MGFGCPNGEIDVRQAFITTTCALTAPPILPSTRDPGGNCGQNSALRLPGPGENLRTVDIGPPIALCLLPSNRKRFCRNLLLPGLSERFKDGAALVSRWELLVGFDSVLW